MEKPTIMKQYVVPALVTGALFVLCCLFFPFDTYNVTELADRIGFAICCLFISSFSIIMGIFASGHPRGNSNAHDSVNGGTEDVVGIPDRNFRNTTEQFLLHAVAMLTLTLFLEGSSMKVMPILSGIFLLSRILSQVGYSHLHSPIFIEFGFASSFIPTLTVYMYCLVCIITKTLSVYDIQ